MKHGHKEKGKAAKATHSGKKSSPPKAKSKAGPNAKGKTSGSKAPQSSAKPDARHGVRPGTEGSSFTNPIVAAAFRRAVKKYPTAFRRLTD